MCFETCGSINQYNYLIKHILVTYKCQKGTIKLGPPIEFMGMMTWVVYHVKIFIPISSISYVRI